MLKKIVSYITVFLSDDNAASHKRLISVTSFIVLLILSFMSAYGHTTNDSFIWVFASLTGGESVLTVIEKFRK